MRVGSRAAHRRHEPAGRAAGWEIALTLALSLLLTAGLLVLTGRVYGNSVMRSGARVRLRDALSPL